MSPQWIYTTPFSGHYTSARPTATSCAPPYGSSTFKWTLKDQLQHTINSFQKELSEGDIEALQKIINKSIVKNI